MAEDTDVTESHQPVPAPDAPPPPRPPPRALIEGIWPWLALVGVLVVAGLVAWLFLAPHGDSTRRTVPSVTGERTRTAISELTRRGFDVRAIVGPSARPKGIVVSQDPAAGSRLERGGSVRLHVSNGRAVRVVTTHATTAQTTTTAPAASAAVPDVAGQPAASAAGQVEAAGFVAETDPVEASGTPGTVVGESPAAGTAAPAGGVVRLSVAVGSDRPRVQVPGVVGATAAAARAALLDATLTVRTVYAKRPAKDAGVVVAQSATGSLPAYTQVTLTVGR